MPEPTNYIESNALLAAQQGDREHARELLDTLLLGELGVLATASRWLAEECEMRANRLRSTLPVRERP